MGMKKGLLGLGILVCFVFSILMVSGAFAAKDEITFDASMGKVKFAHKKHRRDTEDRLRKVSSHLENGQTSGKLCKECHKEKAEGKTLSSEGRLP